MGKGLNKNWSSLPKNRTKKIPRLNVKADALKDAVDEILMVYEHNVTVEMRKASDEAAEETVQILKDTSPRSENHEYYAEGWKSTVMFESALEKRVAIWQGGHDNRGGPLHTLVHLLEWGHIVSNGPIKHRGAKVKEGKKTFVQGHPHLMPAYEKGKEIYNKKILEAIKNANNDT